MKKTYWLNKDKNSIEDIVEVHRRMEKAGCKMGSPHSSRSLPFGSFNYHFKYDASNNRYFAYADIVEEDDVNIQKPAEWFLKFIDNNFIEPLELKYIDNSSESATDTFLDKQLKTINN